jgi:hypothetical protein
MQCAIRFVFVGLTIFAMFGCGQGGTLLPSGPTDTHRGEADAINPARNVTVVCEKDKNGNNTDVTVNITNNCNKNNPVTTEPAPAP